MYTPFGKQRLSGFDFPNDDTSRLFKAILSLQSVEECESFFRDLCTLQEIKSLSERWKIALLIWQGFPYRTIIRMTGASSTTIARVSHWLQYGNGGFRALCAKMGDAPDARPTEELKELITHLS